MDTLKEVNEEIAVILRKVNHDRLADSLDLIPEENRIAVYNMISDAQAKRVYKGVIALQVSEDIGALLEGKEARFSQPFLNAE
jgi:hypothetical protein